MKTIFTYCCVLLCLAAAGYAFVDLRAYHAFKMVARDLSRLHDADQFEHAELAARAQAASAMAGASSASHFQYAHLLKRSADGEPDPGKVLPLLCTCLEALGRALRREPFSARALLHWAGMRQLLASTSCGGDYTEGDHGRALDLALRQNPADTRIMFTAAIIRLWDGDKTSALPLFRKVLQYDTSPTRRQENYILSQIRTAQDVAAVVPPRFPQVTRWSELLLQDTQRFAVLAPALATLQRAALNDGKRRYARGQIPLEMHLRHLFSLLDTAAAPDLRREADAELARCYTRLEEDAAAGYLARRARYNRLTVPKAVLAMDTRPARKPLAGWGGDVPVIFDNYYTTVGFYLPHGRQVHLIELTAQNESSSLPSEYVRVFGSLDNENWSDLTVETAMETATIGGRSMIALRPGRSGFRYWKLHFSHTDRRNSFRNSLDRMLQVYGE